MNESDKEKYQKVRKLVTMAKKEVRLIFSSPCMYTKNMRLSVLNERLKEMEILCGQLLGDVDGMEAGSKASFRQSQRDIPAGELSKYSGKNGSPAYVAVNGTVYDVTNNAAWAAATHFGLSAGKDLSGAFASCHVDPSVLAKLTIVGRLV